MKELRKGMWAVVKGRVGIVNSFDDVAVEFHEVDEKGHTVKVDIVAPESVAQAAFNDIPKARRPDVKVAKKFGYA